jgi:formate hydrogenlyase subunit 4
MIEGIIFGIIQGAMIFLIAPMLIGIIRKCKAILQSRRGASIVQPYYELLKLFSKGQVISKNASWVFRIAPYIGIVSMIIAATMVPVFINQSFNILGNVLVVIYLLAMFRIFMTLAALDTASAFGGMGSSRESMISAIVEPTVLLSIYAMATLTKTVDLPGISGGINVTHLANPALWLAFLAFFIVMLGENARYPFDNPTTHLELTMVHEAMILEYSGKRLGLMEYASWTKLTLFMTLLANMFFPFGIATTVTWDALIVGIVVYVGKVVALAIVVAIIESSMAKFRLFKLPFIVSISFTMAFIATMLAFM